MRKLLMGVLTLTAVASFSSPAVAQDTILDMTYENRGKCDVALAQEINRVRGLDLFGPGTRDDVNRRAHARLSCVEMEDGWHLVRE
jgi:hypothetical protein